MVFCCLFGICGLWRIERYFRRANPFLSGLTYQQAREQICAESYKLKAEYQTYIKHYQTERELKMENGNLNAYPDLIITKSDDSEIYIEFERTQKSPKMILKQNYNKLSSETHNNYVWQELNIYEIWNNKE